MRSSTAKMIGGVLLVVLWIPSVFVWGMGRNWIGPSDTDSWLLLNAYNIAHVIFTLFSAYQCFRASSKLGFTLSFGVFLLIAASDFVFQEVEWSLVDISKNTLLIVLALILVVRFIALCLATGRRDEPGKAMESAEVES